jgi:hypothetical protein
VQGEIHVGLFRGVDHWRLYRCARSACLGWVRWTRQPRQRSIFPILSLVAFAFATASGLLAVSSVMYSVGIGGFPYYDPRLLRIFRLGILLSLAGIALGLGGVWRPSSLRWYAPASAIGTLMFWIMAASME